MEYQHNWLYCNVFESYYYNFSEYIFLHRLPKKDPLDVLGVLSVSGVTRLYRRAKVSTGT